MHQLRFWPLAFVLGGLAVVTYTICLAADGIFSGLSMYKAWAPWLPGVSDLSIGAWLLGSAELVAYTLYASAVLVGLTRLVASRAVAVGQVATVHR